MAEKQKIFYKTKPTIYSFIWRFVMICVFIGALFAFQFAFKSIQFLIEEIKAITDVPEFKLRNIKVIYNYIKDVINKVKHVEEYKPHLMNIVYLLIYIFSYSTVFGIRKFCVSSFYEKDAPKGIAFLILAILLAPIMTPLYCLYAFFHLFFIFIKGFDVYVLWRVIYMILTVFAYGLGIYYIVYGKVWLPILLFVIPLFMRIIQIIKNAGKNYKGKTVFLNSLLNIIFAPIGVFLLFHTMILEIKKHMKPKPQY